MARARCLRKTRCGATRLRNGPPKKGRGGDPAMHPSAKLAFCAVVAFVLISSGSALAAPKPPKPPVTIETIAPVNKVDKPLPLNASSGWQLDFRITIAKSLGLATAADYGGLPGYNN